MTETPDTNPHPGKPAPDIDRPEIKPGIDAPEIENPPPTTPDAEPASIPDEAPPRETPEIVEPGPATPEIDIPDPRKNG